MSHAEADKLLTEPIAAKPGAGDDVSFEWHTSGGQITRESVPGTSSEPFSTSS